MDVYTTAIRSLAAEVAAAKADKAPQLLLRLKENLQHTRQVSKEQREAAYRLLWRNDLLHVLAGVTRRDYSLVAGGWDAGAQLAELLATVCSGLRPQRQEIGERKKGDVSSERAAVDDATDFYDKLLPTAVDSLLILANNILERATTEEKPRVPSVDGTLHSFQSVCASLSRLCSSHAECAFRAVQSPLTLKMMAATGQPRYSLAVVAMLNRLQPTSSHTPSQRAALRDVLAYKITACVNDRDLQIECLKLLASSIEPKMLERRVEELSSRHPTLASTVVGVVSEGGREGLEGAVGGRVEQLVKRLEMMMEVVSPSSPTTTDQEGGDESTDTSRVAGPPASSAQQPLSEATTADRKRIPGLPTSSNLPPSEATTADRERVPGPHSEATTVDRESVPASSAHSEATTAEGEGAAASVIQASWRGYATRRQQRAPERENVIVPLFHRHGGVESNAEESVHYHEQEEDIDYDEGVNVEFENDMPMRKQLQSLNEMRTFHENQMAILERLPAGKVPAFLQHQQRRAASCIQHWWRRKRGECRQERAALVIQRAVRQFLRKKNNRKQPVSTAPGYSVVVEGREREQLQAEIDDYCRHHVPPRQSEAEFKKTHNRVQRLLREFYSVQREPRDSSGEPVEALLSRLERDCDLLLGAPRLGELGREEGEIDARFTSGSSGAVATMAQQMHLEEVKAMELLWENEQLTPAQNFS